MEGTNWVHKQLGGTVAGTAVGIGYIQKDWANNNYEIHAQILNYQ